MRDSFSAPWKINLGCTANRCSGSLTVLKNVLKRNAKMKYIKDLKVKDVKVKVKVRNFCDNPVSLCFWKNILSG